jgi:hypothetical protein
VQSIGTSTSPHKTALFQALFSVHIVVVMAFDRLARFEHEGATHYGDLVETTEEGYLVKKLNGSITDGFTSTSGDAVLVENVRSFCRSLRQESQR